MIALLSCLARGADWEPPTRVSEGIIEVPGGASLLVPAGSEVQDVAWAPVNLWGHAEGLLVAPEAHTRWLSVSGADTVRHESQRAEAARWVALERTGDAVSSELPDAHLVALGIPDAATRRLSLLAELESTRLRTDATHVRRSLEPVGLPVGETWTTEVVGPGVVVLALSLDVVTFTRGTANITVGARDTTVALAGVGATPAVRSVWVPPGVHTLTVGATAPLRLSTTVWTRREDALHRALRPPEHGTLAAAEWAWWTGSRDEATALFRPFVDAPGAPGDLARARVIAGGNADEARALLAVAAATPEGERAAVVAALGRSPALDAATIEPLLVDMVLPAAVLAPWLDSWKATRARGVGLLRWVEHEDGSAARERLRLQAQDTRFQTLDPISSAGEPAVEVRPEGPGTPRMAVAAGSAAVVLLPAAADPERLPLLRLASRARTTYAVDGVAYSGSGELHLGLAPGPHTIEVREGELLLLDPETVLEGGRSRWEWPLTPLPAVFPLPDPGVPAELRALVLPPEPVRAVFDDGHVETWVPDPQGRVRAWAPSAARTVRIEGTAKVGVGMRTLPRPEDAPAPYAQDLDSLSRLTALSRAVDAGDVAARIERARILAAMGWLGSARVDLGVALAHDASRTEALSAASALAPEVPSTGVGGVQTLAGARARHAELMALPDGDPLLTAMAGHAEPDVRAVAARALAAQGRMAEALALAVDADPSLAREILDAVRFEPARADRGSGLVAAPVTRGHSTTRAALIRRALTAAPFDGDDLAGTWIERVQLDAPAHLRAFCRDDLLQRTPCTFAVLRAGRREEHVVEDGAEIILPFGPGAHEVRGPGEGRRLVLRWERDGTRLTLPATRSAERATPTEALVYTVAGGTALRAETVRGTGRLTLHDGRAFPLSPLASTFAVTPPGAASRVLVEGDVDLRLAVGALPTTLETLTPPTVAQEWTEGRDIRHLLAAVSIDESQDILPGAMGTGWVQAGGALVPVAVPRWDWSGATVAAGWQRRGPTLLAAVGAFGHLPWAGGLNGWIGDARGAGYGALGWDAALDRAGSNHFFARARGGVSTALSPSVELRGTLSARAGSVRLVNTLSADPVVATQFLDTHPVYGEAWGRALVLARRDLRLGAGLGAGIDPVAPIDRLGARGELAWAPRARTLLAVRTTAWRRLPDADRSAASTRLDLDLGARQALLWRRSQRLEVAVGVDANSASGLGGEVALAWSWSKARGLRDALPWEEPLRTLREPWEQP